MSLSLLLVFIVAFYFCQNPALETCLATSPGVLYHVQVAVWYVAWYIVTAVAGSSVALVLALKVFHWLLEAIKTFAYSCDGKTWTRAPDMQILI